MLLPMAIGYAAPYGLGSTGFLVMVVLTNIALGFLRELVVYRLGERCVGREKGEAA